MDKSYVARKASLSHEWIKSSFSGVSYLCPVGVIRNKGTVSEEELQRLCLDESRNPQND